MRKDKYDVIIIGAGPAGAVAAQTTAAAGLRTLIIEKKNLPRRKACSGILIKESQDFIKRHYGDIPAECLASPQTVKGIEFHFAGGRTYRVDDNLLNIWRAPFDHWLVRQSGAELAAGTLFENFLRDGKEIKAVCRTHEGGVLYTSRFLIGADGGNSYVLKALHPAFPSSLHWFFNFQKYFSANIELDRDYFHYFANHDFGLYTWVNMKDDYVLIGTGIEESRKFYPYYDLFLGHLREKFGLEVQKEHFGEGCRVNSMAPTNRFMFGDDRVLLAGEAAGFFNMLGEGISSALASGKLAGEAVVKATQGNKNAGEIYQRLVRTEQDKTLRQWNIFRHIRGNVGKINVHLGFGHLKLIERIRVMGDFWSWLKGFRSLPLTREMLLMPFTPKIPPRITDEIAGLEKKFRKRMKSHLDT